MGGRSGLLERGPASLSQPPHLPWERVRRGRNLSWSVPGSPSSNTVLPAPSPSFSCLLAASPSPQGPRPQLRCLYSSDQPLSLSDSSLPPCLPLCLPPSLLSASLQHSSSSLLPLLLSILPPSSLIPPPSIFSHPSSLSILLPTPFSPPSLFLSLSFSPSLPPSLSLPGKKGHGAADYSELSCCSNRRGKWDRLALRTREVGRGRLEPARAPVRGRPPAARSARCGPAPGCGFNEEPAPLLGLRGENLCSWSRFSRLGVREHSGTTSLDQWLITQPSRPDSSSVLRASAIKAVSPHWIPDQLIFSWNRTE
ncbi:uncharacterized protein LOC117703994 [Arvicanthis niloticus]|uniref:uncharacterized protein LOC117703994 n=1 Tax=Arvicanthis niloticus TaxID=61156 RepID=UPI00402B24AE